VTEEGVSAKNTTAEGEGLSRCVAGGECTFNIILRDDKKQLYKRKSRDIISVTFDGLPPDTVPTLRNNGAIISVLYRVPAEIKEPFKVNIRSRDEHIMGSPFTVMVQSLMGLPVSAVNQLLQWTNTTSIKQWTLLYRASRDGWSNAKFHSLCDGRGKTVVLARRNSGEVFGGYATMPWRMSGTSYANGSFIFSLTDGKGRAPIRADQYNYQEYALCYDSSFGPVFGGGYDLYLHLDSPSGPSYSKTNNTYKAPQGMDPQTWLAGSYSGWTLTDVEVYLLP
jgi:hypothetical protein